MCRTSTPLDVLGGSRIRSGSRFVQTIVFSGTSLSAGSRGIASATSFTVPQGGIRKGGSDKKISLKAPLNRAAPRRRAGLHPLPEPRARGPEVLEHPYRPELRRGGPAHKPMYLLNMFAGWPPVSVRR